LRELALGGSLSQHHFTYSFLSTLNRPTLLEWPFDETKSGPKFEQAMNIVNSDTAPTSSIFTFNDRGKDGKAFAKPETHPNWWKSCTCYQIWPASFKDSNGDGLGDIPGILSKLDYLHDLGVDVIWLSPMYASPQVDMGYDISDYNAVYPPYGTMVDMESLIDGLHLRGMRLILDLVVNHTSDQHKWFQESKKGRDRKNEYADWYIWRDPKIIDGKKMPPNNWGAFFGGSAWEYVEERDQYYLHLFERRMPDLNWENPTTRKAIRDSSMRFWFEKGVDGFRVDTASLYSKVQTFPDGEVGRRFAPYGSPTKYCVNGPRIHEFYKEMRAKVLDEFDDPMMVGELGGCTFKEILQYVSSDERELSMVFDFELATLGGAHKVPFHEVTGWTLPEMKTALKKTQDLVANPKTWSTIFAENHDIPRSISTYGTTDLKYHDKASKVLAMLLGTLSGTLFPYQGQEIGMTNIPESWSVDDLRDVASLNYWKKIKKDYPKDKEMLQKAWQGICAYSRDNARTPVQWSDKKHAGFTTGQPWMRVNDNYEDINIAAQLGKSDSVLHFWTKMLKIRKEYAEIFVQGGYCVYEYDDLNTFTFEKKAASGRSAMVMLNFGEEEQPFKVPDTLQGKLMKCLISNNPTPKGPLSAWEGRVYVEQEEP
jgi:oligo-1,6-glucosidase